MNLKEKIIEKLLLLCSLITVFTTAGIIAVLIFETVSFFKEVSVWDFLTDTQWTPLFTDKHYGILALLSGTVLTTFIAMIVAVPLGLTISVYLSEYAHPRFRDIIKPMLEILAAVPTVVYGYFALMFVTPILQDLFKTLGIELAGFNALSPGIVMGIMILPLVSSLSEDALYAVPKSLREGSLALGSTRFQTAWKVVVPAAFSGISVSIILAVSRAIGETMIVAIAAGQQPNFTFDPTVPIMTMTTYIVQVSMGDVPQDSLEYRTIFAVGMSLFVLTFILNNISFWLKKKYQETYL
jgi:phosphate transport system permease protein